MVFGVLSTAIYGDEVLGGDAELERAVCFRYGEVSGTAFSNNAIRSVNYSKNAPSKNASNAVTSIIAAIITIWLAAFPASGLRPRAFI